MEKSNDRYIKVYFSDLENPLFCGEPFSKLHAWADLLFLANNENKVLMHDSIVCQENGEVHISLRDLCKRWRWGNTRMNSFLHELENEGKITLRKSKISSCLNVSDYDTYLDAKSQNASHTKSPSTNSYKTDNVHITEKKEENFNATKSPVKSPTKSLEKTQSTAKSPTKSPKPLAYNTDNVDVASKKTNTKNENASPTKSTKKKNIDFKEKGKDERKENKKENFPHTPLKEINKEKKEEKGKEFLSSPNVDDLLNHACVCVRKGEELTLSCEKPSNKKKEKEYTLTWRARLVFSNFYKERYGEEKYWKVSEMNALSQLLKQIKFSRSHKENPLPVDDDSLLAAFTEFLNRICTPWILQNFLVTNLNSKYDTIIQDIKNKKNGTSIINKEISDRNIKSGQSIIEHQKQDCINELRELEKKLAAGQIVIGRKEIKSSEIKLPDF